MALKVLALFIMSEDDQQECASAWRTEKTNFIGPMLTHCLTVNLYGCISEVLNNLSVSSHNEDLRRVSRMKKWFGYLF